MYSCISVLTFQRNLAPHSVQIVVSTCSRGVSTQQLHVLYLCTILLTLALKVSLIICCLQFNRPNCTTLERSLTLYGDVLFKQWTVTEFFMVKRSVMLIHKRLKNVYGVNDVVTSTVSRASRIAISAKGQAELVDARRSGRPTAAAITRAFLGRADILIRNNRNITTRKTANELSVYKEV